MKFRLLASLLLAWMAAASAGCTRSDSDVDAGVGIANDRMLATLVEGKKLTVYEGLPHQLYDADALASELKQKETLMLHEFPFYSQPLKVSTTDLAKLVEMLSDPRFFKPFGGEKTCGGFHPDYAVTWSAEKRAYAVLICFSCSEVKVFGPDDEARYDIADPGLAETLKKYQQQRPPAAPGA